MRVFWFLAMAIGCGGGGITEADLDGAKALVHPLQPKDTARTSLTEKLGAPKTETETASSWETSSGTCKRLTVGWMGNVTGEASISDC